ncbi:MAG: hypothetical protein EXX96DRAFT_285783 [Benjaminiella poitrasii]|nr:MAG: hypothetical protein EXX96DRAFT_285783 [Benjaminiella poitrasii]
MVLFIFFSFSLPSSFLFHFVKNTNTMYDIHMPESFKFKRLWRNRISHQLNGFQLLNNCLSATTVDITNDNEGYPLNQSPSRRQKQQQTPIKRLWRKPLPNDCPQFDFSISEKTLLSELPVSDDPHLPLITKELVKTPRIRSIPMTEKTEIPTRYESRHYENVPHIEARLEHVCKNEKTVLLAKLLEKQRHKSAASIL